MISSVEKVLRVFQKQRRTLKKRSRSYTINEGNISDEKDKSLKLHHISQHDFLLSSEKDKKSERAFLPGVERKKLRKKEDVEVSDFSDEISLIKNIPTPEIYRIQDEEEDYEGGESDAKQESGNSDSQNSKNHLNPVNKRRKRKIYNDINQSEHSKINDEDSIEIDSEDCKSDIQRWRKLNRLVSPGKLLQNNRDEEEGEIIEDIPMSVFESSSSSNSDDTFESYEDDELLIKLKNERTPIKIEEFSEEEDEDIGNEAEQIMASLSDIAIEIDEDIDDGRQNGLSLMNADNGRIFQNKYKKSEKGIRLDRSESVGEYCSDFGFMKKCVTKLPIPQYTKLIDDIKSVYSPKFEDFKQEMTIENTLKTLERQMMDSSTIFTFFSTLIPK